MSPAVSTELIKKITAIGMNARASKSRPYESGVGTDIFVLTWNSDGESAPVNKAKIKPTISPARIDDSLTQSLSEQFKIMTVTITARPKNKLAGLPKLSAASPPAKSVIATLMRLTPILVTTMPVTRGVMNLFNFGMNGLKQICKSEPAMHKPKIKLSRSVELPPAFLTYRPIVTITPTKVKLVPCKQSIFAPTPKGCVACINVSIPDAISDMLIR